MRRFLFSIADFIRETDKILLFFCAVAAGFGCVAVLSSTHFLGSQRQFFTQLFCMVMGFAAAIIISNFDYSSYGKLWYVFTVIALIPVGLTFFIGYAPEGSPDAKSWLQLPGGVTFQPSELLKIAFIITFALHLDKTGKKINRFKYLMPVLAHGLFPVLLIHFQGDDGTAIIFFVIIILMLFSSGLKFKRFAFLGGITAIFLPVYYFLILSPYQKNRILSLFDLEADLQGTGWQQWRGRIALANGGWFGKGLFHGPLTQSGNVPESYNDFIFVGIGEELGFIGCLAVILLITIICLRIIKVGSLSKDSFGMLLCTGVFAMLLTQTIINLGMCLSILPVIGVTLPFFSAGGSSLICVFLGIGIILSVYMKRNSRLLTIYD